MAGHVVRQNGAHVTRPGDAVVVNANPNLLDGSKPVAATHDFSDGLVEVALELIGRGTDTDDIGKFAGILRRAKA